MAFPKIGLPFHLFTKVFPFHLAINRQMELIQIGSTIERICHVHRGSRLEQHFRITRPNVPMEFDAILEQNCVHLLESLQNGIVLNGQMIYSEEADCALYLCSPMITEHKSLDEFGLSLKDFAIQDPIVNFIFLLQSKNSALADAKKFAAKLKTARNELEQRVNERTAELLKANASLKKQIRKRKRAEEELRNAYQETEHLLSSISSILIGVGPDERITRWNAAAASTFGVAAENVMATSFLECGIQWDWSEVEVHISDCRDKDQPTHIDNIRYSRPDGKEGFLNIILSPIVSDDDKHSGYLLLGTDITEAKIMQSQLAQALKLESIGQLAAGIAHEINTPIQYVGDNTRFLQDAFGDLNNLLTHYQKFLEAAQQKAITAEKVVELETAVQEADVEYLVAEIPQAIEQTLEGVDSVANIVRAMKEFSHPGG